MGGKDADNQCEASDYFSKLITWQAFGLSRVSICNTNNSIGGSPRYSLPNKWYQSPQWCAARWQGVQGPFRNWSKDRASLKGPHKPSQKNAQGVLPWDLTHMCIPNKQINIVNVEEREKEKARRIMQFCLIAYIHKYMLMFTMTLIKLYTKLVYIID